MSCTSIMKRVAFAFPLALTIAVAGIAPAKAADLASVHFLIPGGAGGGWDGTARGTGEALTKAGLEVKVDRTLYKLVPVDATQDVAGSKGQALKQK